MAYEQYYFFFLFFVKKKLFVENKLKLPQQNFCILNCFTKIFSDKMLQNKHTHTFILMNTFEGTTAGWLVRWVVNSGNERKNERTNETTKEELWCGIKFLLSCCTTTDL